MKNKKILIYAGVIILIIGLLVGSYFALRSPYEFRGEGPIKILFIDDHGPGDPWSKDNFNGFNDYLSLIEISVEIRTVNFDEESFFEESEKIQKVEEIRRIIEEWDPDLVYSIGETPQEYIGKFYADSNLPWVFSGFDGNIMEYYGPVRPRNVAGVIEEEHLEESLELLVELYPFAKNIVFIGDPSRESTLLMKEMREKAKEIDFVEFVSWEVIENLEDFKQVVNNNQNMDAFMIMEFDSFGDELGGAIRWFTENSNIPGVSIDDDLVELGVLLGVDISGYEQGRAAGILAKEILIDGEKPSNLEFKPTQKGDIFINLARAKQLNLRVPSIILVNAEIIEKFPWDSE